jgi:hypothetical protein
LWVFEMLLRRYATPEEIARFVEAAEQAGTLGRIKRQDGATGRRYAVTCGGCAFQQELEGSDRFEARMDSRERAWRERDIPGLRRSRHFCPKCLWDMDLAMRFCLVAAEQGYCDYEEAVDRQLANWTAGNPYALPFGYRRGGGESQAHENGQRISLLVWATPTILAA